MRNYLKIRRKEIGKTQANVAMELNVSESYYNLLEAGKRQRILRADMICKLSDVLGIPIEEIIKEERG